MYKLNSRNKVELGEVLPMPLTMTLEPLKRVIWWVEFNGDIKVKEKGLPTM